MNKVNLNALRVFAIAASHGNLQRAAEELNLSRGAVSQRIKQLELDLGVVLLVREARGVSLTAAGKRYHTAVNEALETLDTALVNIQEAPDQITLHLGSSTATKWLMPRMNDFVARFPNVSLTTQVHSEMLSRSLGRNEIAIWPGDTSDKNPAHVSRRLTDIELVAVCSPNFPRPDCPMTIQDLLTLPLLQDAHQRWQKLIAETGQGGRKNLLNFDRSALALDAAIGGNGVAIAPAYLVEGDLQSRRLEKIWTDPEPSADGLYISWSKEHMGQLRIKRIVEWVASEFS